MILTGRSGNEEFANDKYKFTGKERDVETGYDYFGARYYDSRIGRWLVIDPLFEKYPGISPYIYSLNNPATYFDLDGKVVWGPGVFFAAGGALEAIGWATIATGMVISAVGPENTGKGIINFGEQIGQLGGNIMGVLNNPVTPTPFPITQGEGITQTTIAPSDETNVSQNLGTLLDQGFTPATILQEQKTDSCPSEKHGDSGRTKTKAEKQIEKYKEQLKTAKGTDAKKIKQKIKNVTEDAQRKAKGTEDSRIGKRK